MSDIEDDCLCDDPRHEGHKLWLCGSDLCKRLLNRIHRNGYQSMEPLVVIEEDYIQK